MLQRLLHFQADSCVVHFANALFVPISACGVQNSAHPLNIVLMQHCNASYLHNNKCAHTVFILM